MYRTIINEQNAYPSQLLKSFVILQSAKKILFRFLFHIFQIELEHLTLSLKSICISFVFGDLVAYSLCTKGCLQIEKSNYPQG